MAEEYADGSEVVMAELNCNKIGYEPVAVTLDNASGFMPGQSAIYQDNHEFTLRAPWHHVFVTRPATPHPD